MPNVAQVAQFDAQEVSEHLQNVAQLSLLTAKVTELLQRLQDSRLVWLSKAWGPSLSAYAIAKVVARHHGALRTVLAPLAKTSTPPLARLAKRRRRPSRKPTPPKPRPEAKSSSKVGRSSTAHGTDHAFLRPLASAPLFSSSPTLLARAIQGRHPARRRLSTSAPGAQAGSRLAGGPGRRRRAKRAKALRRPSTRRRLPILEAALARSLCGSPRDERGRTGTTASLAR